MRAAWYDRPGPARDVLQIGDLATPTVRPGEVLIEIRASGINPSDYKRRGTEAVEGSKGGRIVPHSDGSGTVVAVGGGVRPDWLGQSVWIWNAINRRGYAEPGPRELGTAAEFVAIPLEYVAILPDETSFEVGACLGVPAFTAYAALFADGPLKAKTVLVQGGAGAVGELAVQLASQAGATVIATVSSDQKGRRALAAGAHHAINYREQNVVEQVEQLTEQGVDRIIEVDFGANIDIDARIIKSYGTIAAYSSTSDPHPVLPYYSLQYKGASVRTIQVFTMPTSLRSDAVEAINAALKDGRLRPTIAEQFTLDDVALAHEAAENRPEGNIVLSF
jgi:NADPH2:quinone reductase